jgi:hypothetical protein
MTSRHIATFSWRRPLCSTSATRSLLSLLNSTSVAWKPPTFLSPLPNGRSPANPSTKARPPQYNGSASTSTLNDEVEPKVIRVGKPDALEAPASSFRPPKFLKWSGKASREHLAKEPAINIVPPEMTPSKPRSMSRNTHSNNSVLFDLRGAITVGTRCGDLISVVLVGVWSLFRTRLY